MIRKRCFCSFRSIQINANLFQSVLFCFLFLSLNLTVFTDFAYLLSFNLPCYLLMCVIAMCETVYFFEKTKALLMRMPKRHFKRENIILSFEQMSRTYIVQIK